MERINELLHRDMTRKEFLATVGFGVASLFGVAALVRMLTGRDFGSQNRLGYGAGPYGGRKNA